MSKNENDSGRRDFLVGSAAVVGAAMYTGAPDAQADNPPTPPAQEVQGTARIVQVEHSGATTSATRLDEDVCVQVIEEALKTFAGTATAAEALGRYFEPTQKIAIKVNTLGSPYSAVNTITANTLARLLQEMGAPVENVRIFDQHQTRMRRAGYRLTRREGRVWVTKHRGRTSEVQHYEHEGHRVRFHWDKTIDWPDAVINVCIPKDHDLTGITGALKNMALGTIEPTVERAANTANPGHYTVVPRFHKNNCDPAIPWLYSQPMIRGKVKLILADAFRCLYHGGPQDKARYRRRLNQIWVATDPVAVDATMLKTINDIRAEEGMKPVEEDLFRNRPRLPTHIQTAARMGLGIADLNRIEIEKRVLA